MLETWSHKRLLKFNPSKTKNVCFSKKVSPLTLNLFFQGEKLECVPVHATANHCATVCRQLRKIQRPCNLRYDPCISLSMSSDSDTSKVELTSRQPRARIQVKIPPYTGREVLSI